MVGRQPVECGAIDHDAPVDAEAGVTLHVLLDDGQAIVLNVVLAKMLLPLASAGQQGLPDFLGVLVEMKGNDVKFAELDNAGVLAEGQV